MLVRAYRLTDKLGLVVLKIASAFGDMVAEGVGIVVHSTRRGSTGVLGTLFGALLALIGGIRALLVNGIKLVRRILFGIAGILITIFKLARNGVLRVGTFIWTIVKTAFGTAAAVVFALVNTVFRFTGRAARSTGSTAVGAASGTMARRAAQSEAPLPAVGELVAEDPLRVQNRMLNRLVIVLGAAIIVVVLIATDPARNSTPIAPDVSGANLSFQQTAPEPTVAGSGILNTPVPTSTPIPEFMQVRGTIAYVVRENGQQDIWAVGVADNRPVRLTNSPADERDPAWSPVEGELRLAYASRQDDNWEIYIYDVQEGTTTRLTYDLSFQAGPQWSPDGSWLVYESYQGDNLDIYVMPVDGSQPPLAITDHLAPDFSPVWSPGGREIAFVSWRDGNQDIYVFDLDTRETYNLTNTPTRYEDHPSWSPDGALLTYGAVDEGVEKVFVKDVHNPGALPQVFSRGRAPSWSPDSEHPALVFADDTVDSTHLFAGPYAGEGVAMRIVSVTLGATEPTWTTEPLPAALVNSGGLEPAMADPLYMEQVAESGDDPPYSLNNLVSVSAPRPYLSDKVNDSFNALRERTLEVVGWDFLGQLENAFWDLNRPPQPGESARDWHKTGRAFSLRHDAILGFPPPIEVAREELGVYTYWHVYVRVADEAQSGQLGEPLRQLTWNFLSRDQGDVEAYNQGGRLRTEVPGGYYVDFTQLAADYGWLRIPAGSDWLNNVNSRYYWLFQRRDGLEWYGAMREIYAESQLGGFVPTPTPTPIRQSGEESEETQG